MKSLLLLAAPCLAALLSGLSPLESVTELPAGWSLHSAPPASDVLSLSISIRHDEGDDELKRRLGGISDPRSGSYGAFLSREEVRALRSPSRDRVDAVLGWLGEGGVEGVVEEDWVRVEVTVGQARDLLGAEVAYYTFSEGEEKSVPVLRAREYGVPEGVRDAVGFIHPLSNFLPLLRSNDGDSETPGGGYGTASERRRRDFKGPRARQVPDEPINPGDDYVAPPAPPCANRTTPACIRELYNITYAPEGADPPPSEVTYAAAGFLEQFLYHPDTDAFMTAYAPYVPLSARNVTVELVNNGTNPQVMSKAGLEASLDVQYAVSLSHPVPVTFQSTGGRGAKLDGDGVPLPESVADNEPYLEWLEHMLEKDDADIPRVVAVSYADDEQGVPRAYALKVCDLFAAIAARGVTVIVATGDGGSRGVRRGDCRSNDGLRRPVTMASFPGTCPYVTAVGAVSAIEPPQVATFSTGGFSIYFERPGFQDADVEGYIERLEGHLEGHYNASGRAIPDVSAIGTGFAVQWGGGPSSVMGTSAAVPVFASMVALINDARRRRGLPWTGWLNPRLYSEEVRGVLRDIVTGVSAGCAWDGDAVAGWKALDGWDCGTGIGVPGDFMELLEVFLED
ncbi:related to tripeptidyl-peptidase I [Cephalotrichum gorgonifer]|uniref:tripeptidyl-peptidase II n=1 Tax=Cephalotrichum gorgonifer TaxID=2041049 RepID=A0AAE8SUB2_9PEZI|nr:related to tripeptidyl-peptidase I [Cephalotrichum gorgonifer]